MSTTSKQRRDQKKKRAAKRSNRRRAEASAARSARHTTATLFSERKRYVDRWRATSDHLLAGGHYAWMASFVRGFPRVLEIGTGVGNGTIVLLRDGHAVVSIDENPDCLAAAMGRIQHAGFPCVCLTRGTVHQEIHGHRIEYDEVDTAPASEGATLIEADLVNDPRWVSWVKALLPFDAVVCWLAGSHRARPLNVALTGIGSPQELRLSVQNRAYTLADEVLRPGGVLHVVDRREPMANHELLRSDALRAHREQASPTNLVIADDAIEERLYEEPRDGGVEMIVSAGISGRMPDMTQLALTSIISRRM